MVVRSIFACAGILVLSGCVSSSLGASGGAAIDAFANIGEQPASARIVEAMAGGLIGQVVGGEMDRSVRNAALEAEYHALEYTSSGKQVTWQSANGQISGSVVAGAPYRVGSQDCRQYIHRINTGGRQLVGRGTACRNDDGSWTPLV